MIENRVMDVFRGDLPAITKKEVLRNMELSLEKAGWQLAFPEHIAQKPTSVYSVVKSGTIMGIGYMVTYNFNTPEQNSFVYIKVAALTDQIVREIRDEAKRTLDGYLTTVSVSNNADDLIERSGTVFND